jgi:putative endonuclease
MDGTTARGRRNAITPNDPADQAGFGGSADVGRPAERFEAKARGSGHGPPRRQARNRRLGAHGEAEAARYLERAGYRIIERNWVCRDPDLRGELDLIARLRRTLVVFEVKTRSTNRLAHPAEAVTTAKAVRLRRLAVRWLANHRSRPGGRRLVRQMRELRIDVIAIRTRPEPPFAVLELDHLIGVA